MLSHVHAWCDGMSGLKSRYLFVWFRVTRRPNYYLEFQGKGLIMDRKGIKTPNALYLR